MHELIADKPVIFLDVGNTIDRPASGDWMFTDLFYGLAGEQLKQRDPEEVRKARRAAADFLLKNHLVRNEEEEAAQFRQYYRIVSDRLRLGLTEDELAAVARDRTYNMDNYVIYPDVRRVMETLSRTRRLGIISDTWPSIENQLRTLGVLQYVSFMTCSYMLGVFKPDRRIFLDALEKCGHAARETVFIDDAPQNLAGAARLGITPILIAADPGYDPETPFAKIHSLSELL
ncbi:MAG: HAD-IA family hydrolase [Lachnospiraceae bacterium]|nr:HAD-IA family hydrolase [Lachnospiraceae bacterium]